MFLNYLSLEYSVRVNLLCRVMVWHHCKCYLVFSEELSNLVGLMNMLAKVCKLILHYLTSAAEHDFVLKVVTWGSSHSTNPSYEPEC